jgi:hypothetical protein
MIVACPSIYLFIYIVKSSTPCTVIFFRKQCSKNYSKHFVIITNSDPARPRILVASGTLSLDPAPVELGSGVSELGVGVLPLDPVGDAFRP